MVVPFIFIFSKQKGINRKLNLKIIDESVKSEN